MKFYVGLHHPADAVNFERSCISVNVLKSRKSYFEPREWMMDSGAFTEIAHHGRFRTSVSAYAQRIHRWSYCGRMVVAVAQDWMCEPVIIAGCPNGCRRAGRKPCHPVLCTYGTGLSVAEHQRLTIERYDELLPLCRAPLMPVLQGFEVSDYLQHLSDYGDRITEGLWVGVGSVCKRNTNIQEIESILGAIKEERPDLRLHGFGLKITALSSPAVRELLYSADSMAWSYAARMEGRNANDWREAKAFIEKIQAYEQEELQTKTNPNARLAVGGSV